MKKELPRVFDQLMRITAKLEKHYKDVQDFEFTIEGNILYMLQTRNGKRTAAAAVKIAVDMVKEKLITKEEALLRLEPQQIDQLLHPVIDPKAKLDVVAKGLPASPGAATGAVVFHANKAVEWATEGKDVILVRKETSPDDIHGMDVARGILTAKGGMTSHAAVVARQMGKTCVAGCGAIDVDETTNRFMVGGKVIREGDFISLNGSTGEVILGKAPLHRPRDDRLVRGLHVLGGRRAAAQGPRQRRHAAGRAGRARLRGRGDRAVPHGAHVLRRGPDPDHAGDDPLPHPGGPRGGPVETAPDAARRFQGAVPGDEGVSRDHPPPGSAPPRVPPQAGGVDGRGDKARADPRGPLHHQGEEAPAGEGRGASRVQPDARSSRLPARDLLPRDHPDAGARHLRGGVRRHPGGDPGPARGHDPLGQHGGGDEGAEGDRRRRGGRDDAAAQEEVPLHRGDDDRAAARRGDGGRDRDRGGFLLLRHERPHPDDVRVLARRLGKVHPALHEPVGALPAVRHEAGEGSLLRRVQGDVHETDGKHPRSGRIRDPGPGRCRAARADGHRERTFDTSDPEGRDLRGARRRPEVGRVLPQGGARLRLLFPYRVPIARLAAAQAVLREKKPGKGGKK